MKIARFFYALCLLTTGLHGAVYHYTFTGVQVPGPTTGVPLPIENGAIANGSFSINLDEGEWRDFHHQQGEVYVDSFNVSLSNIPGMGDVTLNYSLTDFTGGDFFNISIVRVAGAFTTFNFRTRGTWGLVPEFSYPGGVTLSKSGNFGSGFAAMDGPWAVVTSGYIGWSIPELVSIPEPSAFGLVLSMGALGWAGVRRRATAR